MGDVLMARAETPPEAADGGFWYVVPAVPHPTEGGRTVGVPGDWCAWYGEGDLESYAVVRTPTPVSGIATAEVTVNAVLASSDMPAGVKPRARIGGR